FVCHRLGDTHDRALAGGVRRDSDSALEAEHTGNADNLAPGSLFDELSCNSLTEKEHGFSIDGHHIVPVFLRKIDTVYPSDDTSVVHQNVDVSESLDCLLDTLLYRSDCHQICHDIQIFSTESFDLLLGFGRIDIIDSNDVCSCFGKPKAETLPETRAASG